MRTDKKKELELSSNKSLSNLPLLVKAVLDEATRIKSKKIVKTKKVRHFIKDKKENYIL